MLGVRRRKEGPLYKCQSSGGIIRGMDICFVSFLSQNSTIWVKDTVEITAVQIVSSTPEPVPAWWLLSQCSVQYSFDVARR